MGRMARRRRRSFLPALGITMLFWFLLGLMIVFVDPVVVRDLVLPGSYVLFFLLLSVAVFLTASLVLGHQRRGLLVAIGVAAFLALRLVGLGHVVNALLLGAFLLVLELAASARH